VLDVSADRELAGWKVLEADRSESEGRGKMQDGGSGRLRKRDATESVSRKATN